MSRRVAAPLPWLARLLALYLTAPLAAGIGQAFYAGWRSVDIGTLSRASLTSLASATAATAIIALCGIPLGYLLARVPGRAPATLGFVVQLPPLTSGTPLLFLVGYSAPLGRLANGALTDSFFGIVLAEVFVAAPFRIIAARSAFAAMDPVLEVVSATLGRGSLDRVCIRLDAAVIERQAEPLPVPQRVADGDCRRRFGRYSSEFIRSASPLARWGAAPRLPPTHGPAPTGVPSFPQGVAAVTRRRAPPAAGGDRR